MNRAHIQPTSSENVIDCKSHLILVCDSKERGFRPLCQVDLREKEGRHTSKELRRCRSFTQRICPQQGRMISMRIQDHKEQVVISRQILLRAIPLLEESPYAATFKSIVIPNVADNIDDSALQCFGQLCEAMYKSKVTMGRFSLRALQGAYALSVLLSANGIIVLLRHLLEDAQKIRHQ